MPRNCWFYVNTSQGYDDSPEFCSLFVARTDVVASGAVSVESFISFNWQTVNGSA